MSVLGIAREVAALTGQPLTGPALAAVPAASNESFPVELTPGAGCVRFASRVIRGPGSAGQVARLDAGTPASRRAASDQRRGRRHQLRDARTRPADARVRPARTRRRHRRAPRAGRGDAQAARRPRDRDGRIGAGHCRPRQGAGPGRRHGRRPLRHRRRHHRRAARSRVLPARRDRGSRPSLWPGDRCLAALRARRRSHAAGTRDRARHGAAVRLRGRHARARRSWPNSRAKCRSPRPFGLRPERARRVIGADIDDATIAAMLTGLGMQVDAERQRVAA